MEKEKQNLSLLLRKWRNWKGLTQGEFGKLVRRSKRTIVNWENGRASGIKPDLIASCLGITVMDFYAGPDAFRKEEKKPTFVKEINDYRDINPNKFTEMMVPLYMLSDLKKIMNQTTLTGWSLPNRIGVPGQVAVRVDVDTPAAKFGEMLLVIPYENQVVNGERIVVWDTRKERAMVILSNDLKPQHMTVIGLIV